VRLGPGEKKMGLLGPRGEREGKREELGPRGGKRERGVGRLAGLLLLFPFFFFSFSILKHSNNYLNSNAN
jgi:hypothetical protein